jgi:hypothetical protein
VIHACPQSGKEKGLLDFSMWKKRLFMLEGKYLFYYKDPRDKQARALLAAAAATVAAARLSHGPTCEQPSGVILLQECTVQEEPEVALGVGDAPRARGPRRLARARPQISAERKTSSCFSVVALRGWNVGKRSPAFVSVRACARGSRPPGRAAG